MFHMPRRALPRLRPVNIKGERFWQISIPQPKAGRRLRTFKDKVAAQQFFTAVQENLKPDLARTLQAEAEAYVQGKVPVRRRKGVKVS